jgi:hypothetical protein
MRGVRLILRILGLLFVSLECLFAIIGAIQIGSVTDVWFPLVMVVPVSIGLCYWAYRVIWSPIKAKVA